MSNGLSAHRSEARGAGKVFVFGSWVLLAGLLPAGAGAQPPGYADPSAHPAPYVQANLVSDIAGIAAVTDMSLQNPWGTAHTLTSPLWVNNQLSGVATIYSITAKTTVSKGPLTVSIPTTSSGHQGPTGMVWNGNAKSFLMANGTAAAFIFADLNGQISAWNGGTTATVEASVADHVYTGLAINGGNTQLYAANDAGSGSIDVFDSTFKPVTLPDGAFVDPMLPSGLVPFNVQDILGDLYVLYAPSGHPAQLSAQYGAGAVAIFDEAGNFIKQLIAGDHLAAPWGITLAPAGFGRFSNDLLIGNFSYIHSEINAYNVRTGRHVGTIPIDTSGNPPGGLWSITFGLGGSNGDPNTLYFADGINSEQDGLLGAISPPDVTTPPDQTGHEDH